MEEIERLVIEAADGSVALADRLTAFGRIVHRFQDMAYGYAYAVLGDFHLAQDAAQEAFLAAIRALPEHQRMATTLFYINGYSQKNIADFLEVPITTVKKRLVDSRTRLKERMIAMVSNELKSHALPGEFPQEIQRLLTMPQPLEIPGHPVREIWEAFRSCFSDFEEVQLDEVLDKTGPHVPLDAMPTTKVVYAIDDDRILRTDLSRELVGLWLGRGGGPCRLIAAGRTFRKGKTETPWKHANVFHQAEILWVEKGLDHTTSTDYAKRVATNVMPNTKTRLSSLKDVGGGVQARECEAEWRGDWLEFGVSGMHSSKVLEQCGLDAKHFGAICIAFGLERCAQIRYGIDDIRKLWQPPYVP